MRRARTGLARGAGTWSSVGREETGLREIVIGAAQMGPIQKADSRAAVVERMITPKPITH